MQYNIQIQFMSAKFIAIILSNKISLNLNHIILILQLQKQTVSQVISRS
jgi:hypothetical protein